MNRKFRLKKSRLAVRVSIFVLLFAVFGVVNASAIEDKQEIPKQLGDNGQEAIDRLGSRLPDVAADYGLTAVELEEYFRSDSTLFVDSSGELYYSDLPFTEDTAFLQADSLSQGTAPFDESETFTLHSLPGATHLIYLDFDGHTTVAGTTWNGGASFYSPPYDIDGDPSSFSASEIEIIQKTWQLVAEDYSPFMVDVTTEDPGPEALSDQGNGDVYYGTRVVVTDDTWSNCGCGGQAYVGSFDDRYDEPAFVYNQSLRGVAEAASHEVGHTVYLSHDGTSTASYYHGHGTGDTGWAPLMGASYYKPVTQWSMGDYYDCNNSGASANYGQGPDDLAVIASMTNGNAFGYRADDHGAARQAASALNLAGDTISGSGIIEQTDDVDVFSFNTGQGDVNITVSGAPPLSNLDIYAELRDESGAVVTTADPADLLSVSLSASLDAGTYYLHIDGTGTGDPMNPTPTGYTQHASLGQYTISGTVANPEPFAKYVILMIGDGMGFEQVKAANYFNGGELSFETLPYTTSVSTYSADSSITDSAASATAMAAGQKVNNGVISMASPGDGSELQTVLEIFKAQGKNVGLVSTAFMSHATPAAFGAHEPSRDNYGDIANDYLTQTVPHVLFGGGANGMSSSAAATAGYTVVTDRVGMQALDTEGTTFVSGQFGATHLPYEYDGDYSSLPHLDEMTETAINILDNNDVEGFFVMIEGGRIDHAGHSNELERNIHETLEFSDTVQKVLDWVDNPSNDSNWSNTLVLVTADHETGGLTVIQDNGAGAYPSVTWSTTGHTGVNVPLYAIGDGADQISALPVDNTDIFDILQQQFVQNPNNPPSFTSDPISESDGTRTVPFYGSLADDASDPDNHALSFTLISGPAWLSVAANGDLTGTPGDADVGLSSWIVEVNDSYGGSDQATLQITVRANDGLVHNRISDSSDDVEERASDGALDMISSDIELGDDPGYNEDQTEGLRFQHVMVPQGAYVTGAYLEFTTDEIDTVETLVSIQAEDSDDAPAFVDTTNNVSNRGVTSASVSWDIPSWSTVGELHQSPDLSAVVQEVIDRAGWSPGGSMIFVISGTGSRTSESYDGDARAAAVLHIEYDLESPNSPPTADDQEISTNEDTPVGVTLTASDVDGDGLTFSVSAGPSHGLLSGTAPNLTYTPDENYNGPDSFTFTANDGTADSAEATVSITIDPVNDAPEADDQSISTPEGTSTDVTLTGSDVDGDPLSYVVISLPGHGTLTGSEPDLTYTPEENYNGSDSFTFTTNDGTADSAEATVNINVTPMNDPPVADDQSLSTSEDTPVDITLTGSDADGDSLTYAVTSGPSHGSLSGTMPNLTYTPEDNYYGPDSFTFTANDGIVASAAATVSINVDPVNDDPAADPKFVSTEEDTPVVIALTGSDVDGDTLTFSVTTNPSHGSLSGTAPDLTYSPDLNYYGPDSFVFKVNDGAVDSALATVSITINAVNDAPLADDQSLAVSEDTPTEITLLGSDVEGDPLGFTVISGPSHGSISGTAPDLTYSPDLNYNGPDSFTFTANDGIADSAEATVSITVDPVNDAPSADGQSATTDEDTLAGITLTGADVDGDGLTFSVTTNPSHGALSGAAPNLTYTPDQNYYGPDSFTFTVNDGELDSAQAEVSITVDAVNDQPAAEDQTTNTSEDTPVGITLTGLDTDGDILSFTVTNGPSHGSLSGSTPELTYAPFENYNGPDSFNFIVDDGTLSSAEAIVSITIDPINDPPSADDQSVSTQENTVIDITLTGSDVEEDALSFTIVDLPLNGSLSGTPPNMSYSPNAGFNGADSFTFIVNDGSVDSQPGMVSISVAPVNDPPVADNQDTATNEDTAVAITLTGSDPEGDSLSFQVSQGPSHGSLSGTAPYLTYTPDQDFNGSDSFSFTVFDGLVSSDSALVSITVDPINDAPTADNQSVELDEDSTKPITLTGFDVEGDALTYHLLTGPSHGSLTGIAPDLTYSPDANFYGADSITFSVSDGTENSNTASVNITVLPVNDVPTADDQSVDTDEDIALVITLTGFDLDNDPLTFAVAGGPSHGALSGVAPNLTYTPDGNFYGADSFTFRVSDGVADSPLALVDITVNPINDAPIVDAGSALEITLPDNASLDGTASDDGWPLPPNLSTTWSQVSGPGAAAFLDDSSVDTSASFEVPGVYMLRLTADDGELTSFDDVMITVNPAPSDSPYLQYGVITGVGESWVPVSLDRYYSSMVVVATANLVDGDPSAVVRIRNAQGDSFEVRVDGAGGGSPSDVSVFYMVVEEGVYNSADHGVTMEAVKYLSKVTDGKSSWNGESRTFANSYSNPVVVGQVMSYSDSRFSVFWSRSTNAGSPPSSTDLRVGKHVGEDPDDSRADEIIGYVVFEAGTGAIEGTTYVAGLGADTVGGFDNSPPYNYSISGIASASTAVASQAGMDGNNGSWAHFYGAAPVSAAQLSLVVDEDQMGDSERSHSPEQVAYIIFGDPVANQAPAASFTQNVTDLTVEFTDISTDSDGTIVAWSWDFGDGSNSFEQNPTHFYGAAGSYDVTLTVTDDDGASGNKVTQVTVTAPNLPPTAGFTHNAADLSVTFNDNSTDVDGTIVAWSWDFGDGTSSDQQNPVHFYGSTGSYNVALTVTDDDGATDDIIHPVSVTAANIPPAASFSYSTSDLSTMFTDTSTDSDGTIVAWSWDFGDGGSSADQNPTHVYSTTGTYDVVLTATDNEGASSQSSQPVNVALTPTDETIYLSSSSEGSVGQVHFDDEDIVSYDTATGLWVMVFDGSDMGMDANSGLDIDAFHIMDDGSILLSIVGAGDLPDVGAIDESDIVRFIPTSTGEDTAGTFEWYFDGSDVGLTNNGEDIDAIFFNGSDLILSTSGGFSVPGATGKDEDLIRFSPTSLGADTSGVWSLYFDGSDVGLDTSSDEDSWGVWIDETSGDIYLTARGFYSAGDLSGDSDDIFVCSPLSLGEDTSCAFSLHVDGQSLGFTNERIDGITISRHAANAMRITKVTADLDGAIIRREP